MADPFKVAKGTNPSNPFGVKAAGGAPHHGSLLGNLAHDVGAAVTGLPAGIVNTVKHPVGTAKELVQVEKQTWSPLIHGHFGQFYRGFHEHPLGPLLDVATLLGAGAARGFALADLPEEATTRDVLTAASRGHYAGPLKSLSAKAAENGGEVAVRTLPRNAARAARMQAVDRALKKLPPETRVVGEFARAARAVRRGALPAQLSHLLDTRYGDYLRAWHGLKPHERVAVALLARVPLKEDLERWRELLPKDDAVGQKLAAQTLDPKVLSAYENPSEKVLAAHAAASKLAQAREEILAATSKVEPETLAARPYLHMRIARGATFQPESKTLIQATAERDALAAKAARSQKPLTHGAAQARLAQLDDEHAALVQKLIPETSPYGGALSRQEQLRRNYENSRPRNRKQPTVRSEEFARAEDKLRQVAENNRGNPVADRVHALLAERDKLREALNSHAEAAFAGEKASALPVGPVPEDLAGRLHDAEERVAQMTSKGARVESGMVGGGTVDQLHAEVQAAGRPEPFYLPDVPLTEKPKGGFARNPSGRTPPRPLADVFQNSGALHRVGLLALEPDVLGPKFLSAIGHDYKLALHEEVLRLAEPMDHLRPGYEWVRQVRGQRIPFTATATGTHEKLLDDAFPGLLDETPLTVKEGEGEVATDASGRRLAVSRSFAQELEGEAQRSSDFVRLVIERPLTVWRALVLNLRIPWLVNNILGNAVLAAIRFAGPDGLKAFSGMVGETKGLRYLRRMVGDQETKNHLTPEDMAAVYPELTRAGTFIGSQTADLGRAGKIARRAGLGLAPVDAATESALRRASAETVLRRSPEANRVFRSMSKETRTWRAAMLKASEDPELRAAVVREVNDALGNFLSLSPTEKRLRNVVPFYAWYREITRIALKLPLDQPGRADLLAKIGLLGSEIDAGKLGEIPSYLRGAVPFGGVNPDGTRSAVLTQAANPFTSALQVGQSVGGLTGLGNKRLGASAALGEFNPFAAGVATYLVKTAAGDKTNGPQGAIPNVLAGIGQQLPQIRVATNPPSRLYPGRTRQDLLQWLLGDPRRKFSPAVAAEYARRENG